MSSVDCFFIFALNGQKKMNLPFENECQVSASLMTNSSNRSSLVTNKNFLQQTTNNNQQSTINETNEMIKVNEKDTDRGRNVLYFV
jgi:hypothetical protein